jgi:hypothetical protein
MCLSLEPYDVERLKQLCYFTSLLVRVTTWFTLPSLSQAFFTRSLILPTLFFLSANIFGGGTLSRGTYATLCIL